MIKPGALALWWSMIVPRKLLHWSRDGLEFNKLPLKIFVVLLFCCTICQSENRKYNVWNVMVFICRQTVTRNFKTYFSIRHELLPLLLNGISRWEGQRLLIAIEKRVRASCTGWECIERGARDGSWFRLCRWNMGFQLEKCRHNAAAPAHWYIQVVGRFSVPTRWYKEGTH